MIDSFDHLLETQQRRYQKRPASLAWKVGLLVLVRVGPGRGELVGVGLEQDLEGTLEGWNQSFVALYNNQRWVPKFL